MSAILKPASSTIEIGKHDPDTSFLWSQMCAIAAHYSNSVASCIIACRAEMCLRFVPAMLVGPVETSTAAFSQSQGSMKTAPWVMKISGVAGVAPNNKSLDLHHGGGSSLSDGRPQRGSDRIMIL